MNPFTLFLSHLRESLDVIALVSGLVFTGLSFRDDTRDRQITNLLVLTREHRELWGRLIERKELLRILDDQIDVRQAPPTPAEELFISHLIQHLSASFRAIQTGLLRRPDKVQRDIRRFFSLPLPRTVWQQQRLLLDEDFAQFVEACLD
jgi:hypothetical protein